MSSDLADLREARAALEACGISVRSWAAANNFSAATVYAVLNGRSRARWGESHRVAVALGLKPAATDEQVRRVHAKLDS